MKRTTTTAFSGGINMPPIEREALDELAEILARHLLTYHKEELLAEREMIGHATPEMDNATRRHLRPV